MLVQAAGSTPSEINPVLTSAQARVLARCQRRTAEQGEIVVVGGKLQTLQVSNKEERAVDEVRAGWRGNFG